MKSIIDDTSWPFEGSAVLRVLVSDERERANGGIGVPSVEHP